MSISDAHLELTLTSEGPVFRPTSTHSDWLAEPNGYGPQADLVAFLGQLDEEGFSRFNEDQLVLPWDEIYRLQDSKEHLDGFHLLGLPPIESWRPILDSEGSFTDSDFSIELSGWIDPTERPFHGNVKLEGAVLSTIGRSILLPKAVWETIKSLNAFHGRILEDRSPGSNRRYWAKIRRYAINAKADLSNFLASTVVLAPDRLKIKLRKVDFDQNKMVEVIPSFEDEPARWLEFFDRSNQVQDRYEIPDKESLTHVLISPETKTVLQEIKRMPGRRVAGVRAEAFIRNPYAALGPDAEKVIDPQQFEQARNEARISFARFVAQIFLDENNFPFDVALLIEETLDGDIRCEEFRFENTEQLDRFARKLEACINSESQCCFWEGYDLEILGDTPDQLALLKKALLDWQLPERFSTLEIFDLLCYSERIDGFGIEKPYYSPFIARKNNGDTWFPENVVSGLIYTPEGSEESVALSFTEEMLRQFEEELLRAKSDQQQSFPFRGCPKPVGVIQAEEMVRFLKDARKDISSGIFDPKKTRDGKKGVERKGLVVKPNVNKLDYEERRGTLTLPDGAVARLPKTLKATITLKDYQLYGVIWLQHLWASSPSNCRGALLADDMGLGKTVQLLTFIARCLEEEPSCDPFLVVAPVSLLENWKEEIEKFFHSNAIPVLTLYGEELSRKRTRRDAIEGDLANMGVTRLLVRDWLGKAKVVLTTYETLRDLEFSLARQKWSAMICDEAQKIKNPNAMVTRAAKKQNARLKIACTGTPVENTLVDLWCLFDFIQPGLLGALKDFGERYRRPIEAETDEEKARVKELQALIEPQKLRRTKVEVAKDLPQKIEVETCRRLPISERQRLYYAHAINQFRNRTDGKTGIGLKSHLGLLQYLRQLCSDPRLPGQISTDNESLVEIVKHSPKMAWLLQELISIKVLKEKAIIFCEFRDLQRTLQRAITERFNFTPDIINGDTSANPINERNRQKRIKVFQLKPGFSAIILSPLAVGFGVNIQGANHVIHFTRTWNPAKEDQATDRAYRIGQTKNVYVYYPVIWAEDFTTFDAKLDLLLERKRDLSKDMLNGFGDVSPSDFGDLEDVEGGSAFGNEPVTAEEIGSMAPKTFEIFCAVLWTKQGYLTSITPDTGDGGIDVVAIKGNVGVLIQCKSSSITGQELGWAAVRDVVGGTASYATRYPDVKFSRVAVTNQYFNGMATVQANLNHVQLFDGDALSRLLSERPILRTELEQFL